MFYRESLARLLALEKFRNQIEANVDSGITLYTDHKPGLYESSLSNKGQLSAWRLLENQDLLSIVENIYRQGGKMMLADPLSRVCQPSTGFYDVTLPAKIASVLKYLPVGVQNSKNVRAYFNKDTAAGSRQIQKWKNSTSPISQGKMCSWIPPKFDVQVGLNPTEFQNFVIGTPHAESGVIEIRKLIEKDQPFAVLISISLLPEISRDLLSDAEGNPVYNTALGRKVNEMSKIILASSAEVWLVNIPDQPRVHEVLSYQIDDSSSMEHGATTGLLGCTECNSIEIIQHSISFFLEQIGHVETLPEEESSCFVNTRSGKDTAVIVDNDSEDEHCRWLIDRNAVLGAKNHKTAVKNKATKIPRSMQNQN